MKVIKRGWTKDKHRYSAVPFLIFFILIIVLIFIIPAMNIKLAGKEKTATTGSFITPGGWGDLRGRCYKTDNSNIMTKGTCYDMNESTPSTNDDRCDNNGYLIEYYCKTTSEGKQYCEINKTICPDNYTCVDGACVEKIQPPINENQTTNQTNQTQTNQTLNQTVECYTDAECEDEDTSTIEKCINNECYFRLRECYNETSCDDKNPLTSDVCQEGICVHKNISEIQANQTKRQIGYTTCIEKKCVFVEGNGVNECSDDSECARQIGHTVCIEKKCVFVEGEGVNECSGDSECTIEQQVLCTEQWECAWQSCEKGLQKEVCFDLNGCGTQYNKPQEKVRACQEEKAEKSWLWLILIIIGIIIIIVVLVLILRKRKVAEVEVKPISPISPILVKEKEKKEKPKGVFETKKVKDVNKEYPELVEYIKNSLLKGYSKDAIKNKLKLSGWPEDIIEELFRIK